MVSHWSFGHLQPKLWAKEGPGVKLAVWLPTTKSQESPLPDVRIESATWHWKDLDKGYNFGSYLFAIRLGSRELRAPKVRDSNRDSFGTISRLQLGSPGKKSHLDVALVVRRREYYMGEGGGFLRIRAVVSLVVQNARLS
jgi:hypothetical protein